MSEPVITPSVQVQLNHNYYANLISFSILYYDYLLTLPLEIDRFWFNRQASCSWASFLFFLNRYVSLFGHIPIAMEYLWTGNLDLKEKMCSPLQSYHQYFAILSQLIVGALLITRTYALYEYNRRVLFSLVFIALSVSAFGTWSIITSKGDTLPAPELIPRVGCMQSLTRNQGNHFAIAWSGLLLFDITVFVLTLYKSITYRHRGGRTLLNVLVLDGAMYFGIMVVTNLANILTFLLGEPYTMGLYTTFTNVISSTMISRLMINLRNPSLTSTRPLSTTLASMNTYAYMTTVLSPTLAEETEMMTIEMEDLRRFDRY